MSAMARLFGVLALMLSVSAMTAETKESGWLDNYEKAVAAAKASNKPILADFTGSDWCHWCKKLDTEVFATKEFQDWAEKNVVLLKLDFPRRLPQSSEVKKQNKELSQKFRIGGFPTVVFLSASGEKIGETGYVEGGPEKWIAAAKQAAKLK